MYAYCTCHCFHCTQIVSAAAKLEGSALELREQIQSLWTRLNVPDEEQMSFSQAHIGHKPRVIAAVSGCNLLFLTIFTYYKVLAQL